MLQLGRSLLLHLSYVCLAVHAVSDTNYDVWISPAVAGEGQNAPTLIAGSIFHIEWSPRPMQSLFPTAVPELSATNASLYLTQSIQADNLIPVADGIDVVTNSTIAWKVAVPDSLLTQTSNWTFVFAYTSNDVINATVKRIASPPVVIGSKVSKVANTTTSTTTVATQTIEPARQTVTVEPTASPTASPKTVLPGNLIGGIVVLGLAVVAMLVGGLVIYLRRRRSRRLSDSGDDAELIEKSDPSTGGLHEMSEQVRYEMDGTGMPAETQGTARCELDGDWQPAEALTPIEKQAVEIGVLEMDGKASPA